MNQNDRIDIAMGFDGNYAPHAAATIASVVRHAPGARFRFLMLQADIPTDLRARVERAAPGQDFTWITVKDEDMPAYTGNEYLPHVNRTTLYRLGLEKLAPADASRVLYLDTDLIVLSDVREILLTPIGGQPLAAVDDLFVDVDAFVRQWNLPAAGHYLNAGVLLLDLEKIRREKLFTKAIDFLARHGTELNYADQDALNWVFWQRWHPLAPCWNVLRQSVFRGDIARDRIPAIVHFNTPHKPWLANGWHPWAWLYWDNLARTPFFQEIARKEGVGFWDRQRMRARWIRRRPRTPRRRRHLLGTQPR
jgi:lipopolysaccharide biosynthesis glycosyltransferase